MNETEANLAPAAMPQHTAAASVSLEDVRHVAALASLALTPEEEPRMQRDLNAVLEHVAALQQLDTTGVPPLAQISELFAAAPAQAGGSLRADRIRDSLDRASVMREAPETDGRFFKVPRVIER